MILETKKVGENTKFACDWRERKDGNARDPELEKELQIFGTSLSQSRSVLASEREDRERELYVYFRAFRSPKIAGAMSAGGNFRERQRASGRLRFRGGTVFLEGRK